MPKVETIGPFWPEYRLAVGGFRVPHLSVQPPMDADQNPAPLNDDNIFLSCDHRIGIYTTRDELDRWLPFLADCMAVAAGYPCHGAAEKITPFSVRLSELTSHEHQPQTLSVVPKEPAK